MERDLSGIYERFSFRPVKPEEAEEAAEIEWICFPPHEAVPREDMIERALKVPDLFLVAEEKESGKIAGYLTGIATSEPAFRDEFFSDTALHEPEGESVMLLSLNVLPEYRHQGLAQATLEEYARREKAKGRKRLVLTCLEEKLPMYLFFGLKDLGISGSVWGGETWHEMELPLE